MIEEMKGDASPCVSLCRGGGAAKRAGFRVQWLSAYESSNDRFLYSLRPSWTKKADDSQRNLQFCESRKSLPLHFLSDLRMLILAIFNLFLI